ncbi:hypothetical protein CVT26_011778 [Gymnopilus dilepis]|uniref:Uncharacterized protein n=1 Tax=Gymnopilus dilepis TaxID=231916 RepID=A0A409W927_9AGAR|nr:hypothetical protein CVT26_011778 [Gymnopilus dilepis]
MTSLSSLTRSSTEKGIMKARRSRFNGGGGVGSLYEFYGGSEGDGGAGFNAGICLPFDVCAYMSSEGGGIFETVAREEAQDVVSVQTLVN